MLEIRMKVMFRNLIYLTEDAFQLRYFIGITYKAKCEIIHSTKNFLSFFYKMK